MASLKMTLVAVLTTQQTVLPTKTSMETSKKYWLVDENP